MPRKQTPIQARKSALDSDYAPLYAIAGLTDALAEVLRSALNDTEERGRKRIEEIQSRAPELQKQALGSADELRTFVITLPDQVRNLPESTRARIAELQKQANELLAQANSTYGELAGRGKRVVDGGVGKARDLSEKAETRAEGVLADAADRVDPAFERVQEGVTKVRQTVTGRTATETVTPRTAAKASATRKTASAATAPAKTPAKKTPAKKAPVKTAAAKKATVEVPAKKAAAKKTTAKKTTAEVPAKKTTAEVPAKKAAAKKTPAKKAPAKKAAPVTPVAAVEVEVPVVESTATPESTPES